jgi:hypothetical protein
LEKIVDAYKNNTYSDKNATIRAWEVTWINSTAARVQVAIHSGSINRTFSADSTFILFPTTQDATNYLNAMNKTAYSLASTTYPSGSYYHKAVGHAPQTFKSYEWMEGSALDISAFRIHRIEQSDDLIVTYTAKLLSA